MWLDPDRTSPYQFRQFWVQVDDAEVERYLLQFTLLSVEEIEDADRSPTRQAPERPPRPAGAGADELTALVHGPRTPRAAADAAADVLFGGDPTSASAEALEVVAREVPTHGGALAELDGGLDLVSVLTRTGLAASKGDARRTLAQGGVRGQRPRSSRPTTELSAADLAPRAVPAPAQGQDAPTTCVETCSGTDGLTPRRRVGRLSTPPPEAADASGPAAAGGDPSNRHHRLLRERVCRRALRLLENGREDRTPVRATARVPSWCP